MAPALSRQAVIDKSMASVREAVADGASVMIGGLTLDALQGLTGVPLRMAVPAG